jgi:hypothetical protein
MRNLRLVQLCITLYHNLYVLSWKIENAHWAQKTTATCCGIWETETAQNFVLWLFLNNRNAMWHVKICHEMKSCRAQITTVTVKGNDHEFGPHENNTRCYGRFLLQARRDPTKMFETCWLLGCPTTTTTTRNPGLKDYGLSKARKTELCIQASRQALMMLCLERRRGSDLGILCSLKTCTLQ